MKQLFNVKDNDKHIKYYLCGGVAGALAAIPTTPFDVIKTKLNTQACLNHPCEKRQVCEMIGKKTQKFSKGCGSQINQNLVTQPMQMLFTSKNT